MGAEDIAKFRDMLKRLVNRDTISFKNELEPPPDLLAKLSDKAKAVHAEILKRDFGCPRDSIRALTSALLSEELPPIKVEGKDKWIFEGCGCLAIKMLVKPGIAGAEYFQKDAVLVRLPGFRYDDQNVYKRGFIAVDGSGTAKAELTRDMFCCATKEEISKYVDALPERVVTTMRENVFILKETD